MMLMATSVEIVIYAYGASHKFPWILNCFKINAFYFYKLIEIIIKNEEAMLSRDLIKHLNAVSKQSYILELFHDRVRRGARKLESINLVAITSWLF